MITSTVYVHKNSIDSIEKENKCVSIILCDMKENKSIIEEFIDISIKNSSKFLMFWGKNSELYENWADEILEKANAIDVVTTSHTEESSDEMLNFILNATLPDEDSFRFILFYRRNSVQFGNIIELILNDPRLTYNPHDANRNIL